MRIIFASKFYYNRGGLESYLFKAKELLEAHGHEVIPFTTDYIENYKTEFSDFNCSYYDLSKKTFSLLPALRNIKAMSNMFFNKEAYDCMQKLIKKTNPDIVQGFGVTKHLSYSIFKAAKDMGVSTIMRLSDFALLCPNSTATDYYGNLCPEIVCANRGLKNILKKKCIHNSITASLIGALEVKFNLYFDTYKHYVDYFIAPSRFIRDSFINHYGISPERILYLPIYNNSIGITSDEDEGYFLYAGRLSNAKGLKTLLNANMKESRCKTVIAGTGPSENEFKKYALDNKINVEFVGHKDFDSLSSLIKKCRAVIVPSECYENSPNVVLEAYSYGKPVIGSRIGGIPELIDNNKTGLLFEMGNTEDLVEKMSLFQDNKSMASEMGKNGRKMLEARFTSESHYKTLEKYYKFVTKKKVLIVNNFYYNRGGDCTYLFSLKKLLEAHGHKTIIFSMHHPQNYKSKWAKYFVDYINYDEEVKVISLRSGLRVAWRTIFFLSAKQRIKKLIKEEKPDIAHLQNIHHHITPSILFSLKKMNIPIVWTLHDYQLICPNIAFLADGKICEKCKVHKYYWPLITKCKKGSLVASLMSSVEILIHNIVGINKWIDKFIAPSEFLKNKFIEYGFSKEQIEHVTHFSDWNIHQNEQEPDDYYLFVGRISEEKGIKTLIDAALKVDMSKLKIIGGGPMLDDLIAYAKGIDKNNRIEFLGHKSNEEVHQYLDKCKFLVIPSGWYETSGLVILEAFTSQKPVIGSKIGGIPEIIRNNETGLTFEMGNVDDLSAAIKYLLTNPEVARKMGEKAGDFMLYELSGEKHYQKLIEIYEEAGKKHLPNIS